LETFYLNPCFEIDVSARKKHLVRNKIFLLIYWIYIKRRRWRYQRLLS